jgi:hypothetical protein
VGAADKGSVEENTEKEGLEIGGGGAVYVVAGIADGEDEGPGPLEL